VVWGSEALIRAGRCEAAWSQRPPHQRRTPARHLRLGRLLVRADEPDQVADLVVYVVSRLPA
jgi:hypothetical protein